ncbi:6739_t:CDS:2 [Cetraspora pellucida]|uniref:6739_t:CDS:1 n=1 Tax=Cetraspora pellucida TaxID=1433469 RepID=A0ACA9LTI8_9GLOM|nr:6739_t:CDS:2 [Cetraspora pellucida]
MQDIFRITESRGGQCLSESYINCKELLYWRCDKQHEWFANLNNIKNNRRWCPWCSKVGRYTLKDVIQFAQTKKGECLSEKVNKVTEQLRWKCSEGHIWYATFHNTKNHHNWCPYCRYNFAKLGIKYANTLAYNKNGECFSDIYIDNRTHLLWRCEKKHKWYASLSSIKDQNSWCPYCSKYKRENLCRKIVSKYLGTPSKIRRPDFLKTSESPIGLELDIYYPEYGLAIEVQGEQHEKYIEFFHKGDPNNFVRQQERDQLKKELCEENWIVLREVWYYEDPYIVIPEHLRELGLIE